MQKKNLGRMALALPLLFGVMIAAAGYQILREWESESASLIITGALVVLGGAACIARRATM